MDSNGNYAKNAISDYDLLTNVDAFNNLNLSHNDNSSLMLSHEKHQTTQEMETLEEFESYSLERLFEHNNELQSSNLDIEQEQVPGSSSALFNVTTREHGSQTTVNKKHKIKKLQKKLCEKYSGEAQNSSCFSQNPLAIDNARYIEFNCPAIEGRIGIVDWCKCHECIPMSSHLESICCQEVENTVKYMSNLTCISQHEFFSIFCNRVETVNITQQIIGDVRRPPPRK
ncbi:uncharacterized protein LOC120993866 [Bufo bufo]|uniref:uncharacterized protein LOC120993866 n=1 Tax=Bufo bufo TaxID=8384 RepID=UPI001ABE9338|nr:uncharacterized protein LOC120993866 [Bufo bufo]